MAEPNFDNRTLFHGDNLGFLRGINSESIDLVATDPPFNKGKDFHATPDSLAAGASFHDRWSWERDVEGEWEDAIKDDWPAVQQVIESANAAWGRDMGAFLCYMGVRLLEIHRVLKPTGSLYLHCDDTASAYLTMLLDAIFGQKNRRNVITWERMRGGKGKTSNWGRSADSLLYYTKSGNFTWNTQYGDLSASGLGNYRHDDGDGKGPYRLGDVGDPHGGYHYDLGLGEKPPKRGYRMPEETARQMLADGTLWVKEGRVPAQKRYLSDSKGTPLANVWYDDAVKGISGPTHPEDTGFPTQKPVALYRRIIESSSNEGDFVLDPFCGCATTLIAAEQAGRQWAGIDLWDEALATVQQRVEAECNNLFGGQVGYSTIAPNRTDDGEVAAPPLKSKTKSRPIEPPGPKLTRDEMIEILLEQQDGICAGCDRAYDDPRIWHLDHKLPRSEGGANHISNRALLCPPCNSAKSDKLTLTGLRALNNKSGWMVKR